MNPTKDYIVHKGRIGVPDPAFPYPEKPQFSALEILSPACDTDTPIKEYNEALSIALLHTAWFADEEQERAKELIIKSITERVERAGGIIGWGTSKSPVLPDGLYIVPDMPEWEKVKQYRISGTKTWFNTLIFNVNVETRIIVRFVKEKEPKQLVKENDIPKWADITIQLSLEPMFKDGKFELMINGEEWIRKADAK